MSKKELIKRYISSQSAHSFMQIQRLALIRDFLKDNGLQENTYCELDTAIFCIEEERKMCEELKQLEIELGLRE